MKYRDEGYDSLLSVVRQKRFIWELNQNKEAIPVNYNLQHRPLRQQFQGFLIENGAFYLSSKEKILSSKTRISGKIGIYEMPEEAYFEVDEPSDWIILEQFLMRQKVDRSYEAQIRLLVLDVDGTLTDGGMYYSVAGEIVKKFSTKDGHGIGKIRNNGIEVAIITAEKSEIVQSRAQKLGIKHCFTGIKDKKTVLGQLCTDLGISFENVAYIGDDDGDLDCLKAVGFPACPADAEFEIKPYCDYICKARGGYGAVREVCEFILCHLQTQ